MRKPSPDLKLPCLLLAALLLPGYAAAAGTSSAAFLRIGWGARPAAMGDAFVAAADDADALYWNPAGLNSIKRLQQTFGHNSWLEGLNAEHAAFAFRRDAVSVIGAGVGFLSYGDIERGNKYGYTEGFYSASDMALLFSYARRLKPKLTVGGNFKIIRERIESDSAQSFALDAGAQYDYKPKIKLGATLSNLGTGVTLSKTACPLPMGLRAGAAYQYRKDLLLTSDINMAFDDSLSLHFGGEYLYPSEIKGLRLLLRGGFKTASMSYLGALSGLSLGFGVEKGSLGFDYALSPSGDFGMAHRLSLKLKFEALAAARPTEIEVQKDGKAVKRDAGAVYAETMQWFAAKAASEKLNRGEQAQLLQKIIEKFEPFGVDVSGARAQLAGLKNGGR